MAKVTSKLQITVPKALADRFGIRPGDDVTWEAGVDAIRIVPGPRRPAASVGERLRLFDDATARQQRRDALVVATRRRQGRGWTRDELYTRARAR